MFSKGSVRAGKAMLAWLLIVFGCLAHFSAPAESSVTLAWLGHDPQSVAYRVYFGLQPGVYHNTIVTPYNRTKVGGLEEGRTYYFVVTAVDAQGNESIPSNEIAYQVPGVRLTVTLVRMPGARNGFVIRSTGDVPFAWVLEASEDYRTWRTLLHGKAGTQVDTRLFSFGPQQLMVRVRDE
jgi:hypothetical protein